MSYLFAKLKAATNRPRRPVTRKSLMWMLGTQAVLVLAATFVVTIWPDKSFAVGPPLFLCFGWSLVLFLEAYEGRLGRTE
ncbi:hypothetical protein LT708_25035 [Pseudomonas syringae pv. syringae]|uniref:hypothetical protein n=1 Tax=Pseudomonas syringae TaxID=317 RepID=UPI00200B5E3C|nr:hypothetical protein [Pseudomonas syringae]MCK9759859.1 hypothetical protein [Pseudomonas syringae pv. syringae]MCK9774850.1 hypothetical protein [Pseudomonas syringae pv. syringae]